MTAPRHARRERARRVARQRLVRGHLGNGGFQQYGKTPALLAQLEITCADGRVERIVTDAHLEDPRQRDDPRVDFMLGEPTTRAWRPPAGTGPASTTATGPPPPCATEKADANSDAQVCPPVRATAERRPVALTEPAPGHWTFDLGQNMVGVVRLKVTGARRHDGHAAPRRDAQPGRHDLHDQPARRAPASILTPARAAARKRGSRASPSTASATSK